MKSGKFHQVPAHHNAEAYTDAYLEAASIQDDKKDLQTGSYGVTQ